MGSMGATFTPCLKVVKSIVLYETKTRFFLGTDDCTENFNSNYFNFFPWAQDLV